MGKKRTKGKTVLADDDSEILEPRCRHIKKGLEQSGLKKSLMNVQWNVCQECKIDNRTNDKPEGENKENPSIWLCLKCGHQGCGRYSQEQHALKHYTTPRSEPHCLVLSLYNWSVWCYLCDEEVQYSSSDRLGQLVDYIRKQINVKTSRQASKEQGKAEIENKKLEKDSKNEQEREKKENMTKENSPLNAAAHMTVKGLSNLGNTCFFNAVMQNLSQTLVLRELLKEVKMSGTIVKIESPDLSLTEPLEINLGPPGPLTSAMCQFLNEMHETKRGIVTPKELFSQVCKKAVRFKGFQQQDSQELLRYLLDGMRAEEIQRVSAGILTALGSPTGKPDEDLRRRIKEHERKKSMPSFVDRIFGGELTSTIMCEQCKTVSLVHESFLDLSLPVLDDQSGKNINDKNIKKTKEDESKDSEEEKDNNIYMKKNTIPPYTSKHWQKKAKKQAKKLAKNQRRQQKMQEKTIQLNNLCMNDKPEEHPHVNDALPEEETDDDSNSFSQEEEKCQESCSNQEDISDRESPVEALPGNAGEADLPRAAFSIERAGDFNGASLGGDSEDEEDLAGDLGHLQLDPLLEPDEGNGELLNDGCPVGAKIYEVVHDVPETAFCTLAPREAADTDEGSIHHCLYQFTSNEKLQGSNKLLCDVCTQRQRPGPKAHSKGEKKCVYTDAKKQMLISQAPPILTLHLKRFQQAGLNLCKVNKHIKFPDVIDLAPFCTIKCKNVAEGNTKVLYSLYGVVEHSGTMRWGHYTAYVKTRTSNSHLYNLVLDGTSPQEFENESTKGQWFHISDTHVQAVPASKVLNSQAYLLFYERILNN
ncbi:ubiquitin carboxyl-terminal hydrolase 16 isoform X2 [Monodelphis domestica]|nr:ubiquitin carboxyl-terminal hydrolase 16 isoform X2 [Monodelphis domestica]XP_007493204.2 ubiquitin carboxyl-terminal hydrolase 16 isoform X2 [Monodelphis domestica]XP_007493205.2 ubiquitin carboxyl-terminal hydrolase 16 isoform X2 [Monodelphis domestica]XP_056681957.1 ubiquitin carboxyl-terminal hydrolase 16 isoform X2 [Monodelphis domestica]